MKAKIGLITITLLLTVLISALCLSLMGRGEFAFADEESDGDVREYTGWIYDSDIAPATEREREYAHRIADYYVAYDLSKCEGDSYLVSSSFADSGESKSFYNVVGALRSGAKDAPTVLITTSYDTKIMDVTNTSLISLGGATAYTEDSLHNYSGLIVFLELIKFLSATKPSDYDVIFVAFGGESYDNAGCKAYLSTVSERTLDSIRLCIDLTSVVGGGDLYVYAGEQQSDFSIAFVDELRKAGVDIADIPDNKYESITTEKTAIGNYDYPFGHLGLSGDTALLTQKGLLTVKLVSGDWRTRSLAKSASAVDFTNPENMQAVLAVSSGLAQVLTDGATVQMAFTEEAQNARIDYAEVSRKSSVYNIVKYVIRIGTVVILVVLVVGLRRKKQSFADAEENASADDTPKEDKTADDDVFGDWTGTGKGTSDDRDKDASADNSDGASDDDDIFEGF